MKKLFAILGLCLALTFCVATVIDYSTVGVYSDTGKEADTPATSGSLSELVDNADQAMSTGTEKLSKVGSTACILVMVVMFIVMMFTKDSRKVGMLWGTIFTAFIAFLGIQIVSHGWIVNFIENIANKYFS